MKVIRTLAFGFTVLALAVFYPQTSEAKGFNNRDFLAMPDVQKKFWLSGAIDILGHVAAIKSKSQGKCVYDWYFKDTANKNGLILASMKKYPDHSPTTVLMALAKRACGTFVGN